MSLVILEFNWIVDFREEFMKLLYLDSCSMAHSKCTAIARSRVTLNKKACSLSTQAY